MIVSGTSHYLQANRVVAQFPDCVLAFEMPRGATLPTWRSASPASRNAWTKCRSASPCGPRSEQHRPLIDPFRSVRRNR